jgi:hypothetical protein
MDKCLAHALTHAQWVWHAERLAGLPSELTVQHLLMPHPGRRHRGRRGRRRRAVAAGRRERRRERRPLAARRTGG